MTDTVNVPLKCRQRLAAEGKAYPRSSCEVCGLFAPNWMSCDASLAVALKAEPVSDPYKLGEGEVLQWVDGCPDKFRSGEWFIALTSFGDRVCLRALPEEYSYDFTTADDTYIKADKIVKWMPFPDSEFRHPAQTEAPKVEQEPVAWEAAAEQVCAGVVKRAEPIFRNAVEGLYEGMLHSVQDYLRENVMLNLSGELDRAYSYENGARLALVEVAKAVGVDFVDSRDSVERHKDRILACLSRRPAPASDELLEALRAELKASKDFALKSELGRLLAVNDPVVQIKDDKEPCPWPKAAKRGMDKARRNYNKAIRAAIANHKGPQS